jgi:hypothetical protein
MTFVEIRERSSVVSIRCAFVSLGNYNGQVALKAGTAEKLVDAL